METKLKRWGDSVVLVLPREFRKIRDLKVGDIINISDIFKVEKNYFMGALD